MSTVLVVSPDYASHYFPLSAVGAALRDRGHRVVVATGPGLAHKVEEDFEHRLLVLGPGSNPGLMQTQDQSAREQRQLEHFFAATRKGMVPTLLHQARNRLRDLLHEPERVASDLEALLGDLTPDVVLVDQLAFGATAAMRGLGQAFISFHPGHPSAISTGWPYGYPPRMPSRLGGDREGLDELKRLCQTVEARFTAEYNEAIAAIDPTVEPVADAFAAVSPSKTLINFPEQLSEAYPQPDSVRYIGSSVRHQPLPSHLERPASHSGRRTRIYASMGSFFSGRSDILRKLVSAFRSKPVDLILASGVTPVSDLGPIPESWTVAEYLPQPALLGTVDLVVTHGGNNTITEALTTGVPLLVGPLSTDQFAAAADIESGGLGRVFDPNFDDPATIAALAGEVLADGYVERAAGLGEILRADPGQEIAADLIEEELSRLVMI